MIGRIAKFGRRILTRTTGRRLGKILQEIAGMPLVPAEVLLSPGPIIVLAPHPDDESLGCGGLLAFAAQKGVAAKVIFMTDGSGSHPGSEEFPPDKLRDLREREAIEAAGALGLKRDDLVFLRQPDGALPHAGPEAAAIAALVTAEAQALGAASIFSTWIFDGHSDHVATAKIARRVARALGLALYYYPIWGLHLNAKDRLSTWTRPEGWRLDIREVVGRKNEAIACHRSQMTGMITDSTTKAPEPGVFAPLDEPYERYVKARR